MIIELSKFNSLTSFSNSDWINSFQPVTLQPQGTLSFKGGFLDYNTSSEQVIELQEDTEITIQTGFYMVCPYTESPEATSGKVDGRYGNLYVTDIRTYTPFDLYVARDPSNNYNLVTSSRQFTIPAGNYSPDEITEILNFNCVNVKSTTHGSGDTFNNNATNNFFRAALQSAFTCALEPTPPGDAQIIARDPASLTNFNIGDKVFFIDFDRLSDQPNGLAGAFTLETINRVTGVVTTHPPVGGGGEYVTVNLHMIKYVLYNQESDDRDINMAQCIKFFRQANAQRPFNPASQFVFDPNISRQVAMMGASQIQFQYNYNNNALFQISYLHTPYYNSGGDEAISVYYMGSPFNNVFQYINTQTGCFFTNLEPKEFWGDILGFDLNSLVVKDNPVNHQLNAPLLTGINITGNLVTYDLLFDKTRSPLEYLPNGSSGGDQYVKKVDATSSQTIPIPATKTQSITTSSFYLIELGGLSDINMINDTDLFRTICAIGSKEYNTQGIISIYPDGSAFYTNNTNEPQYISSFRVRLLDSLSKKPSNTLGSRNSIFVELINAQQQAIQQNPEEEDKKKKK